MVRGVRAAAAAVLSERAPERAKERARDANIGTRTRRRKFVGPLQIRRQPDERGGRRKGLAAVRMTRTHFNNGSFFVHFVKHG